MDYKQDFKQDCWYKDVCSLSSCSGCIRYVEMKYLMDNSGLPKSKQYPQELIGVDDYDAFMKLFEIKQDIVNFVKNGNNLYICSNNTGNGKTTWATKLLLKYFDSVWLGNGFKVRGLFIHVPSLLIKLKNFDNPLSEEYKMDLMETDLVVWDDIGSSSISNYDESQLLSFIDYREFSNKANIFTGNITTENEFKRALGDRLTSRVFSNSLVIKFYGKDMRQYGSTSNNK